MHFTAIFLSIWCNKIFHNPVMKFLIIPKHYVAGPSTRGGTQTLPLLHSTADACRVLPTLWPGFLNIRNHIPYKGLLIAKQKQTVSNQTSGYNGTKIENTLLGTVEVVSMWLLGVRAEVVQTEHRPPLQHQSRSTLQNFNVSYFLTLWGLQLSFIDT